jgi:hypothetical protein
MSMSTRTDTPAPHVGDSHDLIRVHGARENNLKALSVELQKRRLTVFTGVNPSPPRALCGPLLGSIIGPGLWSVSWLSSAVCGAANGSGGASTGRVSVLSPK